MEFPAGQKVLLEPLRLADVLDIFGVKIGRIETKLTLPFGKLLFSDILLRPASVARVLLVY